MRTVGYFLVILLFAVCTGASCQQVTQSDAATREHNLLGALADYGYGAAVAFGDTSGVWYSEGFGLRDRERRLAFEPTTAIDIGSLTKPFTAALVLRLVEEGTFSTGTTLGDLFSDIPADKAGITLHQLLTHTSGLTRSALSLGVEDGTSREDFLSAVFHSDLLYPPGTRFEYSDTGYDLLAAIVEHVTGESYNHALRDRVLEPAGLRSTGYRDSAPSQMTSVAQSYTGALGTPWNDRREGPSPETWYNRGSGGLLSTVEDLHRFVRVLLGDALLSPTSVDLMTKPEAEVGDGRAYGYGWFVEDTRFGERLYHGGDIAGYKAYLAWYKDSGLVVAVVDNVLGWERVTDEYVLATWMGDMPETPPAVEPSAIADLTGPARTYLLPNGDTLVMWDEAGRLVAEGRGQEAVDALFGVRDASMRRRNAVATGAMEAIAGADVDRLNTLLRDRDRIGGMAGQLTSVWRRLEQGRGPATSVEIRGSYPAQDGTVVSLVEIQRQGGPEVLRLIWRGDFLVAIGGGEGLRRPMTLFAPTGDGSAARFEVSSGRLVSLSYREGGRIAEINSAGRVIVAERDASPSLKAPLRSAARELLPVFMRLGAARGLERWSGLEAQRPAEYDLSEGELNNLGYQLLRAENIESGIAVFRRVADAHPDSWNAWDSLGEAYLRADRVEEARRAYAESLRLNPDNDAAKRIIARIGSGPGGEDRNDHPEP